MDDRGRPRLYKDHDSFAAKVDEYFASLEDSGKKPTLAGLAYHMGFDDRESVTTYASYGPDFSRTVKRAKLLMEDDRQQSLLSKDKFTPGIALDLRNNHGWRDTTQSEVSGPNGGPIRTDARLDVGSLSDDQLRALASIPVQRG